MTLILFTTELHPYGVVNRCARCHAEFDAVAQPRAVIDHLREAHDINADQTVTDIPGLCGAVHPDERYDSVRCTRYAGTHWLHRGWLDREGRAPRPIRWGK